MFTIRGLIGPALAVVALAAAGCGDDNNSSSTPSGTPASSTPAQTTTATEDTSGGGSSTANNPEVKAAVDACKQSVDSNPQLSDSVKGDLQDICEKAGSGDAKGV